MTDRDWRPWPAVKESAYSFSATLRSVFKEKPAVRGQPTR
jgi:hypothetical protein